MSSAPLPDDIDDWPEDPYDLLHVDRQADARELKRAYAKLIRIYKPDHAPTEFQRIREAYDQVTTFLKMFGPGGPPWERDEFHDDEDEEDSSQDHEESANDDENLTTSALPPSAPLEMADDVSPVESDVPIDENSSQVSNINTEDQATGSNQNGTGNARLKKSKTPCVEDLVAQGQLEQAYALLREFALQHEHDVESRLQLSWLLQMRSELDHQTTGRDWLVQAVRADSQDPRPRHLYLSLLIDDPGEALGDGPWQVLENLPDQFTSIAMAMLKQRWEWACEWGIPVSKIQQDIERLHREFIDNELLVAHCMAQSVPMLLSAEDPSGLKCAKEFHQKLEEWVHLHSSLDHDLQYIDLLFERHRELKKINVGKHTLAGKVAHIVRQYDAIPFRYVRTQTLQLAQDLIRDPPRALLALDGLIDSAPAVLMQFSLLLDQLQNEQGDRLEYRTMEQIMPLVVDTFTEIRLDDYHQCRLTVLHFAMREVISVETVARFIAELSPVRPFFAELADHLEGDLSLCILYRCFFVFTL